ncbi:hypothetical protein [Floridanema aerugineum]|uniref:Uncharacterized protein n=1 Tax=Floridaenema aerugineum BLCC-F46 TaxID=3153654 RepID=A0ABV4X242_9CYAN
MSLENEVNQIKNSNPGVRNAILADWLNQRWEYLMAEDKEELADSIGLHIPWWELHYTEQGYLYFYGYSDLNDCLLPVLERLEQVGKYYYLRQLKSLLHNAFTSIDEVANMHLEQVRAWLKTYFEVGVSIPGGIDISHINLDSAKRVLINVLSYIHLYPVEKP